MPPALCCGKQSPVGLVCEYVRICLHVMDATGGWQDIEGCCLGEEPDESLLGRKWFLGSSSQISNECAIVPLPEADIVDET